MPNLFVDSLFPFDPEPKVRESKRNSKYLKGRNEQSKVTEFMSGHPVIRAE